MPTIAIDAIIIGRRVRRDLGDIEALAESIRTVGLLHPPVVDGEDRLICGYRRLQAMRSLGWTETPITFARDASDELAALVAERDENTCRKDFVVSEAVAMAEQVEAVERRLAEQRKRAGNARGGAVKPSEVRADLAQTSDPLPLALVASSPPVPTSPIPKPAPTPRAAPVRDRVAQSVGMGRTSLAKAREVHKAAEAHPDPIVRQVAAKAVEEMDATGKVEPAVRKVEQAKTEAVHRVAANYGSEDQVAQYAAEAARAKLRANASKLHYAHRTGLLLLSPESVAAVIEEAEWSLWEATAADSAKWFEDLKAARPRGLRVVNGGRA